LYQKIKIETLPDVGKKVDLDVNAKKTKFIFMSHKQNAGQDHNIRIK
jgi:hypothetical protein